MNMKKRTLFFAVVVLLLAALWHTGCTQPAGTGSPGKTPVEKDEDEPQLLDPFDPTPRNITSAADLAKIGTDDAFPLAGNYFLRNHLVLDNWTPLGSKTRPFNGRFNGQGNTITINSFSAAFLSGNNTEHTYLGIFGYVKGASPSAPAIIKDLALVSAVNQSSAFTRGQVLGLLTGHAQNAELSGISLSGTLDFASSKTLYLGGAVGILAAGGLVKDGNSTMIMRIKPGNGMASGILPSGNPYNYIGGLVGMFRDGGGIENCHNTADLTATSDVFGSQIFAGGIAGGGWYSMSLDYHGYIIDSSSSGNITARAKHFWTFVGGVAGCIAGQGSKIERCYATGTISLDGTSSPWPYIGGITAYNYYEALVSQCYFDGTVQGNTQAITGDQQTDMGAIPAGEYTGGIAGYNSRGGRIENCYSKGTVNGYALAGGIVGQNISSTVSRSYSIAAVFLTVPGYTGGIIAGESSPPAGCYALYGVEPRPGQTGYTGWDFAAVWEMGGGGYPQLRWESP